MQIMKAGNFHKYRNQHSPLAVERVVLSCIVRARGALFYKVSADSDFLPGSVDNRHF